MLTDLCRKRLTYPPWLHPLRGLGAYRPRDGVAAIRAPDRSSYTLSLARMQESFEVRTSTVEPGQYNAIAIEDTNTLRGAAYLDAFTAEHA